MKRSGLIDLTYWFNSRNRRPLILRGARQVGKSTLVRLFAEENKLELIELNLELHTYMDPVFAGLDLETILSQIEEVTGKLISSQALIFLDEIQAAPHALAALRYFYEKRPDLAVIAAGSLLEFTLPAVDFSMPVGRVDYFHLGPITFEEFLDAMGEHHLKEKLLKFRLGETWSVTLDRKAKKLLTIYLSVGGMPEAIATYISDPQNTKDWQQAQQRIVDTYRTDFAKYRKRGDWISILQEVFMRLPGQIGQKTKFSELAPHHRNEKIRLSLEMLIDAKIVLSAKHTTPSRPLSANESNKVFKTYWLDVGLLNRLHRIQPAEIQNLALSGQYNGMLAEQFVAQHLAYKDAPMVGPELYYWLREARAQNAEVDFLVEISNQRYGGVLPIEVKSGSTGRLRSLHLYINLYKPQVAVRFYDGLPCSEVILDTELISLPLYMAPFFKNILS